MLVPTAAAGENVCMTDDQIPASDTQTTPDTAAKPEARCMEPGPDSWTIDPQGNFFCDLPRGHDGLHFETGAPRKWWAGE